jgi:hypothetical protein
MPPSLFDPVRETFNIWVHYGFTGLFVFFSLLVIVYQTWQLRRTNDRYISLLETTTTALANSANGQKHMAYVQDENKGALEKNTQLVSELVVYLKAKDEARSELRRMDGRK